MAEAPGGWSTRELETIAALADTFVPGDGEPRAALAAEALATAADPAQLRQLRLVLRVLESPVANLVLARRPAAFRDLPPADRERYLLSWAGSPIPQRRAAFHAWRKLLTFLAWASEGGDVNPRAAAVGYVPDRPPVTADPSPIRAWALPPPSPSGEIDVQADVVVVGSGAGGGVVACDLARAGRSVVVLEAGPLVGEEAMPTGELDGFDRLYLNHGLTATWDGAVTLLAGAAVGGGTLINWMTSIDAPPELREGWTRAHGVEGWDGPEARADAAALLGELGVTPVATPGRKDRRVLDGASALGWQAAPLQRNGGGCTDCGSCGFGCRRGSKQSGIRVHLADAWRNGARVVPGARVERILFDGGGRVRGVRAFVEATGAAPGGRREVLAVAAKQVVVAGGALGTPGLLARSGLEHPAIGRHLRIHPVPVVAAFGDEPVEMWRGVMQGAAVREFAAPAASRQPYVIESVPAHPGLIALAMPWLGADDHAAIMARAPRIAPLIAVTRDGGEGRVRATRSGGLRVDYRLDASGIATLRHALASMARLARAAGANEMLAVGMPPAWFGHEGAGSQGDAAFRAFLDRLAGFDFAPNRGTIFSAHQMGTARMGAGRRDHACDPWGRVRRGAGGNGDEVVPGLYVADGSLFPTGLGVNPMVTIMALARRVGRTVLHEA